MKLKNLAEMDEAEHVRRTHNRRATDPKGVPDYEGHPMIVPTEVWKNTVVNFDRLIFKKRSAKARVGCHGAVVLLDRDGRIVAKGDVRDLNEKSSGLDLVPAELSLNDIFYLEFIDNDQFTLSQVKVILKRLQLIGSKVRVGVEFVDATTAFQERLAKFLKEKRRGLIGFEELENI